MWIDNLQRQLVDPPDHLRSRYLAFDVALTLSGLGSFICILTAFAGNFIDDENVFQAVVMFCVFLIEALTGLLTICDCWNRYLPNPDGMHFVRVIESGLGFIFTLLSSILVTAFYVKRWEARCELSRGRGNIQKCDCLVASAILGFAATALFAVKGIIALRKLRSISSSYT